MTELKKYFSEVQKITRRFHGSIFTINPRIKTLPATIKFDDSKFAVSLSLSMNAFPSLDVSIYFFLMG